MVVCDDGEERLGSDEIGELLCGPSLHCQFVPGNAAGCVERDHDGERPCQVGQGGRREEVDRSSRAVLGEADLGGLEVRDRLSPGVHRSNVDRDEIGFESDRVVILGRGTRRGEHRPYKGGEDERGDDVSTHAT